MKKHLPKINKYQHPNYEETLYFNTLLEYSLSTYSEMNIKFMKVSF